MRKYGICAIDSGVNLAVQRCLSPLVRRLMLPNAMVDPKIVHLVPGHLTMPSHIFLIHDRLHLRNGGYVSIRQSSIIHQVNDHGKTIIIISDDQSVFKPTLFFRLTASNKMPSISALMSTVASFYRTFIFRLVLQKYTTFSCLYLCFLSGLFILLTIQSCHLFWLFAIKMIRLVHSPARFLVDKIVDSNFQSWLRHTGPPSRNIMIWERRCKRDSQDHFDSLSGHFRYPQASSSIPFGFSVQGVRDVETSSG